MTPSPTTDIAAILRRHGLAARKGYGQNFLADPLILQVIVDAAELPPGMPVLEIGPGLGTLTRCLLSAGAQVTAVELDPNLAAILEAELGSQPHLQIVRGDILRLDPNQLMGTRPYAVVANIPYNITSPIFRHLLEAAVPPARMVLTVQKEVAERICAVPGDMSILALSVQVYGDPEIVLQIPSTAFYPPPKVDSAVVRVDLFPNPLISRAELPVFFRLVRAGFSQKRKTLRNALSGGLGWPAARGEALLRQAGVDPMRRAETLAIPEWQRLVTAYQTITAENPPPAG